MDLLKLMADRYTCRRYATKEVEEEKLLKVLEAGRLAPTSHNNQPQRVYVVKSEEGIAKLMKDFEYNYKAPCYLVCTFNLDEVWHNDLNGNKDSGEIDIAIVITHMMLEAEELGLGACWIGRLNPEAVAKNLNISANEKVVAVLSLGYHREDDKPSKLHSIRRSNNELVKFL